VLTPLVRAQLHRALAPESFFVVQTDNPDYWQYMSDVLATFFHVREHCKQTNNTTHHPDDHHELSTITTCECDRVSPLAFLARCSSLGKLA
jgi:tRNA G46 methylase TrmB